VQQPIETKLGADAELVGPEHGEPISVRKSLPNDDFEAGPRFLLVWLIPSVFIGFLVRIGHEKNQSTEGELMERGGSVYMSWHVERAECGCTLCTSVW